MTTTGEITRGGLGRVRSSIRGRNGWWGDAGINPPWYLSLCLAAELTAAAALGTFFLLQQQGLCLGYCALDLDLG